MWWEGLFGTREEGARAVGGGECGEEEVGVVGPDGGRLRELLD